MLGSESFLGRNWRQWSFDFRTVLVFFIALLISEQLLLIFNHVDNVIILERIFLDARLASLLMFHSIFGQLSLKNLRNILRVLIVEIDKCCYCL